MFAACSLTAATPRVKSLSVSGFRASPALRFFACSFRTGSLRIRWFTEEESKRLFEEIARYFFPVEIFAITTGLRRSNVTSLEWSLVDLDKRMAWMPHDETKAGRH